MRHCRSTLPLLIASALVCLASLPADAVVRRVSPGATGPDPDGSTWATAFTSIQSALDASQPGDEVWVAAGSYLETVQLTPGVGLYGGFTGSEIVREQRDWTLNVTTLDGERLRRLVEVPEGAGRDTVLDGFTLANGSKLQSPGCAIHCVNASPTLRNNRISNNGIPTSGAGGGGFGGIIGYRWPGALNSLAEEDGPEYTDPVVGAAAWLENSNALIEDNILFRNNADEAGGIAAIGGSPEFRRNTFRENHGALVLRGGNALVEGNTFLANSRASAFGGAILSDGGAPTITANVFEGNETRNSALGGAVSCRNGSEALLAHNSFLGNKAGIDGIVHCDGASPTIRNNRFDRNTAQTTVFCGTGASPRIADNVFLNNSASSQTGGGVIVCADGSSPIIVNNTLFRCFAGMSGAVYLTAGADPLLVNNLVAYNNGGLSAAPGRTLPVRARHNLLFANTNGSYIGVGDLTGVDGNIALEPGFVNAGHHNLHLRPDSPCVGAGDASLVGPDGTDMDGGARVFGTSVDIGADEFDGTLYEDPAFTFHVRPDGDDGHDGLSWATAKKTIQAAVDAAWGGDEVWVAAGIYSFVSLKSGVSLYGGFTGTESSREQRDWKANVCTLEPSVVGSGPWIGSVFDGFTISGALNPERAGHSGLNVVASNVTVRNNTVFGAGIGISAGTNTLVEHNVISGNGGGGISASGNAVIRNNVIVGNYASQGGGVSVRSSGVTVRNNIIAGNTAASYVNSPGLGAGIYVERCSPLIVNNTIAGNRGAQGAGIHLVDSSPALVNNIVAFNSLGIAGTPAASGSPVFRHNNVFGNDGQDWSGIDAATGEDGNISADPLFADAVTGNLHLLPASPCRDVGDKAAVLPGQTDIDGDPRLQGAGVDIGADESDGSIPTLARYTAALPESKVRWRRGSRRASRRSSPGRTS